MTIGWAEREPTWVLVCEDDLAPWNAAVDLPVSRSGRRIRLEVGADPSSAPLVAVDDDVAVILDGVLYDRSLLRACFREASSAADDAAFVLAAYAALGCAVFPLLRGSFVLSIWDATRDRLLCARDPTGSHPGFFVDDNRRVLIAASQAALIASPEVSDDLDRLAIARWALLVDCLPRRTFYAKVQRLPPGHLLCADGDAVSVARFWRPDPPSGDDVAASAAQERFRELLEQAVRRCLSLGPAGVFLSGGVDSAAVAAAAVSISRSTPGRDPIALSYVMPHPDANELATQNLLARSLGIDQYVVELDTAFGREGLIASGLALSARRPLPCANPWEPIWAHLAAEGRRRGCGVIVSGEGGNPWFEPEEAEAADALLGLRLNDLRRLWAEERRLWSRSAVMRSLLWSAGVRLLIRDAAVRAFPSILIRAMRLRQARRRLPSDWVPPDRSLRESLAEEWVDRDHPGRDGSFRDWARLDRLESASLTSALGAENHFGLGRSLGIRFLDPIVDPDLVSFLAGLPARSANLNGEWNGLPRALVRSSAGPAAAAALGHAWTGNFLAARMQREAPAAIARLGGLPRLSQLGIVDGKRFDPNTGGNGLGSEKGYYQVWQALACEAWLQGHC